MRQTEKYKGIVKRRVQTELLISVTPQQSAVVSEAGSPKGMLVFDSSAVHKLDANHPPI